MKWIITEDHTSTGGTPDTIVGKHRADREWIATRKAATPEVRAEMLDAFKAAMTDEFRLFDDDGELYYTGLCLDLDDQDGDSAFQPLDWAMNDSGCTRMDYRKKGATEWKTL